MTKVLVALHRIGPYHLARLCKLSCSQDLVVLETRPDSQEYPWEAIKVAAFPIHQLTGQGHPEADPPLRLLDRQIHELLQQLRPRAIVTVGWADRAYNRLLLAAQIRRIPVVIVNDSRLHDAPRWWPKEQVKVQLLRGYSAGLVAGQESRAYLETLGFPAAAIFQPWDVVDNALFERAGAAPQASTGSSCFLCISRFVAKKNHATLLRAYADYQRQGGIWGLRLIGAGPLEESIRSQCVSLPDPSRVEILPFHQIDDLVLDYANATAFILASSTDQWGLVVNEAMAAGLPCLVSRACGCAVDLIDDARTGWSFDPASPEALTDLLHVVERQSPADRQAMVAAARQRLQAFSLESFASGLQAAVAHAQRHPRFSRRASITARLISRL